MFANDLPTGRWRARQVILPQLSLALPVYDLTCLSQRIQEREANRLMVEETSRPFNLAHGALIRVRLIRFNSTYHRILITLHHIVTDEWSMAILQRELAVLYEAMVHGQDELLPELPLQYADFAHWQRKRLQGAWFEQELNYWREQLSGAPYALELQTDRPRSAVQTYHGAHYHFRLSHKLSDRLHKMSRQEGVTLYMILLAVFSVLLQRYSRQDDFCVGTTVANRNYPQLENLIGLFLDTLVLRCRPSNSLSFQSLLEQVKQTVLGIFAHHEVPFERLVDEFQPERDMSRSPLFQVMFILQNAPRSSVQAGDLRMSTVPTRAPNVKFDLVLNVTETEQEIAGVWGYNTDLYDEATISRMAEQWIWLLEQVVTDPGVTIGQLRLLTNKEHRELLGRWNATERALPQVTSVCMLFEAQVEAAPSATALVFEGKNMSYAELNAKANQLAHYLRDIGIKPNEVVAICVDSCPELIIAILGVLKAGAAYVPIDPGYPTQRRNFIIRDAGAVYQFVTSDTLPDEFDVPAFALDLQLETLDAPSTNPSQVNGSHDLAYLIYTSGTTGEPKGVVLQHEGLLNLIAAQAKAFDISTQSRVLQFASPAFDASVSEIFVTLASGATLHLASKAKKQPGPELSQLLRDQAITMATLPPSTLAVSSPESLHTLETIVTAGESCTQEQVDLWGEGRRFINAYGPTEATVCATLVQCKPNQAGPPPIGRPINNIQVFILDPAGNPLPIGIPGELCISGAGLALGYRGQAALTAEKFIPNPFSDSPGKRLYRTGDLARYRSDSNIEFISRIDTQVKIRGFRVELGEIESQLRNHNSVRDCVATMSNKTSGSRHLVAYIVAEHKELSIDDRELHNFLKSKLPEYMLPVSFLALDEFPITPNGKIDRQKLSRLEPVGASYDEIEDESLDVLEQWLAEIWQDVLGLDHVSIYRSFFQLGGGFNSRGRSCQSIAK